MKRAVLFCAIALAAISTSAQSGKTIFVGEISDSQCAMNVHSKSQSHKEMTSTHTMGDTKADCVRECVKKMGGQFVLLTPEGKVYRLSNQDTPDQFAGEKVKVHGTVDKSGTISIEKIEKAS